MRRCGSRVRERLPTRSRLSLAVTAKVDNFVSVSVHGLPNGAKRGWPMKVCKSSRQPRSGHFVTRIPMVLTRLLSARLLGNTQTVCSKAAFNCEANPSDSRD